VRAFILGGTGFMGQRVVRALVGAGHSVTGLARGSEKAARLRELGAEPVIGDAETPASYADALRASEVVINLASPPFITQRVDEEMVASIGARLVQHARNLVNVLDEVGPRPVVVTGGTSIYGDHPGGEWIDETASYDFRGYGRLGEQVVRYWDEVRAAGRLPVIMIQPGTVYGAGSWFLERVLPLLRDGRYTVVDGGDNIVPYVHVDDVAEVFRLAAERAPGVAAIAAVDDEPVTARAFADYASALLGQPPVGSVAQADALRWTSPVQMESRVLNCRMSNARARQLLDWQPRYRTYREGLPAVLEEVGLGQPA